MKNRIWYYVLPFFGMVFGVWYLKNSFVDVVYSDYIRLVNSYLPDVWNPDKFFVGDVLTRIPLNYLARIINTTFFDYRIRFDQALGILSLGLSSMLLISYCIRKDIGILWYLCLMAVTFSLNKWEMMVNGSGWIHFFAFACFYYHYLVLERIWTGREKKGDRIRLLVLPWFITLGVAGPYCAVYSLTLVLTYGFGFFLTWKRDKRWEKSYIVWGISVVIPLCLYIWSNARAAEGQVGSLGASFVSGLLENPGYMIRFFIKSFASMIIGIECAHAKFTSNLPYLSLGLLIMAGYGLALWFQFRRQLYEETLFPLILTVSGILNHLLIWYSRWGFLDEDYGMASRYALQFQIGIFGMLLTFALVRQKIRAERQKKNEGTKPGSVLSQTLMAAVVLAVVVGNGYTTREELKKAPARKYSCMFRAELARDFENRTDEELSQHFEYWTGSIEGGQAVRAALEILKEQKWNVFRE